jgi:ABC-type transporter Mla MlaB component
MENPLLRLSVHHGLHEIHLKVEGKLIRPWCEELENFWRQLAAEVGPRQFCLDLCGATFVDEDGMRVLHGILRQQKTVILANSPLTRQFAEQARRGAES